MLKTIFRLLCPALLFSANVFAGDLHNLHCVSYQGNGLAGPRTYTDCSDGTYAPPWNDGISWFYNRSRLDNFFRQKNEEKIYNRDFLLRTGMTPAEADKVIAYRDKGGATAEETEAVNPEKVNFNIMELAASELFVYSSTDQQKNLTDSYYGSMMSPAHISAKTTPEQKEELKQRLAELLTGLASLKELLRGALAYENAAWGASAADLKKADPALGEQGTNLYGFTKEIAGTEVKLSFRLMGDKLVSVTLSFKPLNISGVELEQLRLLANGRFGWPADCKYRSAGDLDCSWDTASGLKLAIASPAQPDGAKNIEISLISKKLMDEFLGDGIKKVSGQGQ